MPRTEAIQRKQKPDSLRRTRRSSRRVPLRVLTLALLTGILIALSLLIAYPFLNAITWGLALAIMAWPMHRIVRSRITEATVAALVSTSVVMLVIVIPGVFVVYEIGREAEKISEQAKTPPDQMLSRENLEEVPGGNRVLEWMDRVDVDVEKQMREAVTSLLPKAKGIAAGSIFAAAQFLVAMFILFYVFRDRGEFMGWLRNFLPLTRSEADHVLASAGDSVHANLYATVVTGLIDSVSGALLFWFLGLPAPFMWGAVMFVLSVVPVVGAGLVWVPMAIYLASSGKWPSALSIVAWGSFTAVVVDYVLYARLAGDRMRMHPVPALIAFLGGLAVFGLSGMVLGPAIVAMTVAMLELWRERSGARGSAMSQAG